MSRQMILAPIAMLFACVVLSNFGGAAIGLENSNNGSTNSPAPGQQIRGRFTRNYDPAPSNELNDRQGDNRSGILHNFNAPVERKNDALTVPQSNVQHPVAVPNGRPTSNYTDQNSDMSEMQQMKLQDAMDQRSKIEETTQNILKKQQDTDQSIIQNLK